MPLGDMMEGSDQSLLRILHYPPVEDAEPGAIRAAAHEDINLITLLLSGSKPGLQARDSDGAWHDIACDPGMITINNGDMLALGHGQSLPVDDPPGDEPRCRPERVALFDADVSSSPSRRAADGGCDGGSVSAEAAEGNRPEIMPRRRKPVGLDRQNRLRIERV